jgi:hypothetical protein
MSDQDQDQDQDTPSADTRAPRQWIIDRSNGTSKDDEALRPPLPCCNVPPCVKWYVSRKLTICVPANYVLTTTRASIFLVCMRIMLAHLFRCNSLTYFCVLIGALPSWNRTNAAKRWAPAVFSTLKTKRRGLASWPWDWLATLLA